MADIDRLALLKRAYAAIDEQQQRICELEARLARREPLAIVGLSCRFPGAEDPEAYWDLLRNGGDATAEIPAERWNADAFYDPDPEAPGRMYTRRGGFLRDVAGFDAAFFGIAPREAVAMDPQHRLLLETTSDALDRAGQPRDRSAGSHTGVFVGITASEYGQVAPRTEALAAIDAYHITGNTLNAAAGRIAYTFGFRGPAVAVDTACSSSLVAVHLACTSIWQGDCEQAIAAGVHLILSPAGHVALCKARVLSPGGRCRTFDAAADGMARGEGCGVVVIRRLSDARRDGDPIVAVIRGTAVNQDGPSGGLTVPSGPAQEDVIRRALASAGVDPLHVSYVEAHGTATPLGDPIEVRALGAVLCDGRRAGAPLLIGSAKTNFGHLEAAAGMAGLIKVALSLEREELPPHLHFATPSPQIPWSEFALEVVRERRAWPRSTASRIAGVSAFGFSGTNAHVVLEEPPLDEGASGDGPPPYVLRMAARTPAALAAQAERFGDHIATRTDQAVADICYTANTGRIDASERAAVIAPDRAGLVARLRLLSQAEGAGSGVWRGRASERPRVAFLFTGQGAQAAGMGRTLYEHEPVFRGVVDRCAAAVHGLVPEDLRDVLFGSASPRVHDFVYTQVGLLALSCGLAALWRSWGVTPWAVLGHSVGEYAAAVTAGVFDVETAARLLVERARLMAALPESGTMAAVQGDVIRAAAIVAEMPDVGIAAFNAPSAVAISGTVDGVGAAATVLREAGLTVTPLRVAHGFHSRLMEPMLGPFGVAAAREQFSLPVLRFASTVTGVGESTRLATPEYWVEQISNPVRFREAVAAVRADGCSVLVELGPRAVLTALAGQIDPTPQCCASLRGGSDARGEMLEAAASLYVAGVPIDWSALDRRTGRRRVVLPAYPWQRERYWRDDSRPSMADPPAPDSATETGPALDPCAGLVYDIDWIEASAAGPAAALRTPAEVARAVEPYLAQVRTDAATRAYGDALAAMEERALRYAAKALEQMGCDIARVSALDPDAAAAALGVADPHRRLFARMLRMVREDDGWKRGGLEPVDAAAARHPSAALECRVLDRCGRQLVPVLRGTQDPLALLFPADDVDSARHLYGESAAARVMNDLVVQALSAAWPANGGAPRRVLEIGAGTGGTTAAILPMFAAGSGRRCSEYAFTDVSPAFLAGARQHFQVPFLNAARLDIETSPLDQGFSRGAYDVVIAANVLHATRDLGTTLRHVAELMAPGALLIVQEWTSPLRTIDLVFGLTRGWWRFEDRDRRPDHPLLPADGWRTLLAESGFAETTVLGAAPGDEGALARQAVIVGLRSPMPLGRWIVVGDASGAGEGVRAALASGQVPAELVSSAGELRSALRVRNGDPVHVVDLRAPASTSGASTSDAGLARRAAEDALDVAQALIAARHTDCHLYLVTERAFRGTDESPDGFAQAPVWGVGKVLALEHPELHTRVLDVDTLAPATLLPWLLGDSREPQQLLRAGRHLVPRLVARPPRSDGGDRRFDLRFHSAGAYIITGGFGGLGLLLGEWLAQKGAGLVVLVGRHAPSPSAISVVERITQSGGQVITRTADVSDAAAVTHVFDDIRATGLRVAGVFHAAGVLDDGIVLQVTAERLAGVMRPKVDGALNLHRATQHDRLDHFVLFSAATSLFGSSGQAAHAAANGFLDAFAAWRRAAGLPALSVNWGAWASVGAAANEWIVARVQVKGVRPIAPARALAVLEQLMRGDRAQVGVFDIDWARIPSALAALPLVERCRVVDDAVPSAPAGFTETLAAAVPGRRRALLAAHVRDCIRHVLAIPDSTPIDMRQGLFEIGCDSLTAMELRNALQTSCDCVLPATLVFDYPTPHAIATHLTAVLAVVEPVAGAAPAVAGGPVATAGAPAESAADLLSRKLAELRVMGS